MSLLTRGASLIWTGERELPGAEMYCEDGQVVLVGSAVATRPADAGRPPVVPPTILDASGCVIIPGLVNAHHHLLQSAFRTLPDTRPSATSDSSPPPSASTAPVASPPTGAILPPSSSPPPGEPVRMRDWLAAMGRHYSAARVDPQLAAATAAVGLAESLLCGVTTVADHHLTWPSDQNPTEIAEATIFTAQELGCRLVFVRGSAGGDPDEVAASIEELVSRHCTPPAATAVAVPRSPTISAPQRTEGVSADGKFQLAVGPAGVHSDGKEMFDAMREVANRYGLRRRTQANEQVDVEVAQQKYTLRPLELLEEWGWLDADVTLAHLCEITDAERQRLIANKVSATHAPGCDVPMGWGVMKVGALLDAGIRVGLGTSGGGSNDAGNLLADARLALQISSLAGRTLSAREVMVAATAGSAGGLGRNELGCLESGAAADFCCYDISGVADAGVADNLAGLLWASPGRLPRHVVVGGKVVVKDWELQTADARKLARVLSQEIKARA